MPIDFNNLQEERERWTFIYERFYQPLCYFSLSILNDPDKARDVVQSTLIRLWQEKITFESLDHMQNYLYKSIRNASINELNTTSSRSRILKALGDHNPEIYQQEDHFHSIVKAELYKRILDEVSLLPDKTAQVFKLAFLEHKTNPEIAEILSISINTVKVHKNNAKKALQLALKDLYPLAAVLFLDLFR